MEPLAGDFVDNHSTTITTPSLTMVTGLLHFDNVTTTLAGPLCPFTSDNSTSTLTGSQGRENDHHGALMFIVATVVVYGLSIVFFIGGHTKNREPNKDEERQISGYLKRLDMDESSKDVRKFHVIRLKSQMLVDSALGQRHNRRISLVPRLLEPWKRTSQDEDSDNGPSDDDDDDDDDDDNGGDLQGEKKASRPSFKGECRVQTVNELEIPPVPFRGRRFACVGFYGGPTASSALSLHDGHVSRGPSSQRSLPAIKQDDKSVHFINDDPPSSERQQQQHQQQQQEEDPSEILSSPPDLAAEDPCAPLNFPSPWVLSSAPEGSRLAGPTEEASCSSGSTQEFHVEGSTRGNSVESLQQQVTELMPNESLGSVMVTRL